MKLKVLSILVILALFAACFAGCAGKSPSPNTSGQLQTSQSNEKSLSIVTSFYPIYIHTINVAKDIPNVKVLNMTKPQTGCLHDYTLTTDDMKTIETAQAFVVNGAGMEQFLDKVILQLPNLKIVEASLGIELIEEEGAEEGNPHVWVSISNAMKQVQNIADTLAVIDPTNALLYKENANVYIKKLDAQRIKMHAAMVGIQNRNIVTFHEAFPYFAQEFNLEIVSVVEREPGTEPSAKELEETIRIVKRSQVKALFAEPQYPAKSADAISKETGAKLYTLDPVVTGEANGDYDAYIKVMEQNLNVLKEALK